MPVYPRFPDAVNQSAWDAMTKIAVAKNLDCRYFIPSSSDHGTLVSQLRSAANNGADVIVASGKCYETAVYTVQREFPGVIFILIDGVPRDKETGAAMITPNTASVTFSSEESGFIAGYAAVVEGYTSLGFMGGVPDEDVRAYGYGFLQGAEYAARDAGITVNVVYHYTGDSEKSDNNKKIAESMYKSGVDLIFACGGDMEYSVIDVAAKKRGKVICSDTDKRDEDGVVVTSAVKCVSEVLGPILKSIYETDDFGYVYGGKSTRFDASDNGTGLASFVINDKNEDAFDRLYKFTRRNYAELLQRLASKDINVRRSVDISDPSGYAKAEELSAGFGFEFVTVSDFE